MSLCKHRPALPEVCSSCASAQRERAKIVAWLRTFPMNGHALEWADTIEAREDETEDPAEAKERLGLAERCVVRIRLRDDIPAEISALPELGWNGKPVR